MGGKEELQNNSNFSPLPLAYDVYQRDDTYFGRNQVWAGPGVSAPLEMKCAIVQKKIIEVNFQRNLSPSKSCGQMFNVWFGSRMFFIHQADLTCHTVLSIFTFKILSLKSIPRATIRLQIKRQNSFFHSSLTLLSLSAMLTIPSFPPLFVCLPSLPFSPLSLFSSVLYPFPQSIYSKVFLRIIRQPMRLFFFRQWLN